MNAPHLGETKMRKTLTAMVIGLVCFSLGSIFASATNGLPSTSSYVTDGTGDWMGGVGLDYMDITSACIVNVDYWTVRFEMNVVSGIPEDPSPRFIGYVWGLDMDKDEAFSEFPPYAPDNTDLNVRVAFDPNWGWQGYIDGKPGPYIVYTSFSIQGNKVSLTLQLSDLYDATSFLWQAGTVGSFENNNLPSDIAPDYGLPRAPWKRSILAILDMDPDTLNLESKGKWITAYIQLPEGFNAANIDASTILLNETVSPELDPKYGFANDPDGYLVDYNNDGISERMVKFDRTAVAAWVSQNAGMQPRISFTISGQLYDGTWFTGADMILVY